jgi:formylglycine-generating enzyme required for sulfatase activity
MKFDLNDFVLFPAGKIEIGIDPEDAEKIFLSLNKPHIKNEYIKASTPQKIIAYQEFRIRKKLLTLEIFREFVLETSYVTESEKEGWGWVWNSQWIKKKNVSWENPFLNENDQYYNAHADIFPVMQVSWNDAVEFLKWMSNVTGKAFRLPFEYEWEIFGNFAGLHSINSPSIDERNNIKSDKDFLFLLEKKIRNSDFQLGLLWEWTLNWYNGYDDSILNKDFGNIYKVLRGGSLLSENIQRSKEFRFRRCPTARSPYYGFRIVLGKD